MAITDPFTITAGGKQRQVDVRNFNFEFPNGGDISVYVFATHTLTSGSDLDLQSVRMGDARFTQAELVAAYAAQASDMGITITNQQIGQLIFGGIRKCIEERFAD